MKDLPTPTNRALRVHAKGWLVATGYLKPEVQGFYVTLLIYSGAEPVIPASVVKALAGRKRKRYARELSSKWTGGLAEELPDGSLRLTEHQPPSARWRFFGPPNNAYPAVAVSLAEKRERMPLAPWLRRAVIERDERICGLCGEYVHAEEGLDIDHILPVSLGGSDDIDNLQVSHASCNRRKGNRVQAEGQAA